jgi:hypothetical protein
VLAFSNVHFRGTKLEKALSDTFVVELRINVVGPMTLKTLLFITLKAQGVPGFTAFITRLVNRI